MTSCGGPRDKWLRNPCFGTEAKPGSAYCKDKRQEGVQVRGGGGQGAIPGSAYCKDKRQEGVQVGGGVVREQYPAPVFYRGK